MSVGSSDTRGDSRGEPAGIRGLTDELGAFPRELLRAEAPAAAVALLGAVLVRDLGGRTRVLARVVETEAYREDDPASHSHGGRTPRAAPMFAAPGTLYVYRSYGLHWCMNVTVEPDGDGAAVLLRAAIVLAGSPEIEARRPGARRREHLLRGPGCLTAGLDVDAGRHDGIDVVAGDAGLSLARDGWSLRAGDWAAGPRVGIRRAAQVPWRFRVRNLPEVSPYRRSPRASTP